MYASRKRSNLFSLFETIANVSLCYQIIIFAILFLFLFRFLVWFGFGWICWVLFNTLNDFFSTIESSSCERNNLHTVAFIESLIEFNNWLVIKTLVWKYITKKHERKHICSM